MHLGVDYALGTCSIAAKEIFLCEGDLSLRRRSFSAKDIFLCEGDLSLRLNNISFCECEGYISFYEGDLSQ